MRASWLLVGVMGLSGACTVQVGLWPQYEDGHVNVGGGSSGSSGLGGTGGMAESASSSSGGGGMGNPFWENLPQDMNEARLEHTMTKLGDGRILITGGFASTAGSSVLASAEIWDPATLEFTLVKPMNTPRARHTATLLGNANVIVTGGYNGTLETNSMEVYNPNTDTWTPLSETMSVGRMYHAALVLPNDSLLTVSGCCDAAYQTSETTSTASTLPAQPISVLSTVNLQIKHAAPTLTLLPGGRALLVGNAQFKTTEWYDVASATWKLAGDIHVPRNAHTANVRASGHVVVSGGVTLVNNVATVTETVEDFDPGTNQWTQLTSMQHARRDHAGTRATIQGQEDIVWVGGFNAPGAAISSCERASGKTCPDLNVARGQHRAVVVSVNGQERVMVTGGLDTSGQPTKSAEWLRW